MLMQPTLLSLPILLTIALAPLLGAIFAGLFGRQIGPRRLSLDDYRSGRRQLPAFVLRARTVHV